LSSTEAKPLSGFAKSVFATAAPVRRVAEIAFDDGHLPAQRLRDFIWIPDKG
jgi:hypothetical protein